MWNYRALTAVEIPHVCVKDMNGEFDSEGSKYGTVVGWRKN